MYICTVVKNGKIENSQVGDEVYIFNHLERYGKSYIGEEGVTQILVVKQDEDHVIEKMYEWINKE